VKEKKAQFYELIEPKADDFSDDEKGGDGDAGAIVGYIEKVLAMMQ
jgi:hypothetical protein